ncbi:MAG TPA: exo-beta-N-acetylmuramidase NamZ domain-containing protein [Thermoanaerobaculia bacterium]
MRRALVLLPLLATLACASALQSSARVDSAIESAIAAKQLPGGVLWVEHDGHVYERAYGRRALVPRAEAMTRDTIFDLASLTKVVATAPSIWLLIAEQKLALDAPAKRYLQELASGDITIRHLLTHTSGLRPDLDLDEPWSGYDEGIRRALLERPRHTPGAVFVYSDINYLLLGEIVRRISGQPLDVFAKRRIFEPLGMRDTRFRPTQNDPRIAPTEAGLRGVVHDPTARRMGGVAGHAGLFSTAADIAKFARAVMRGGFFPRAMTEVQSPPGVAVHRAGGFDIDSNYSRPRGDLFPQGSYGHTGFTGGFLWIDPSSHTFYVFLSNRVHPDGRGSVIALQRELGTRIAESLPDAHFERVARRVGYVTGGANAMNGIDVLDASGYAALRGLRVGLITNPSGIDRAGNPTIDLLRSAPGVQLVALFSPEHGIRGDVDDALGDDTVSGLPVHSLYGERRKPSPEQLANLDALLFDIQDIGTRFYTYISTMGLAMEAAAAAKVKFIVLDRVNPIGDLVEGPVLTGPFDFIGWHTLPIRHGMTVGELARMFREERGIDVDLTVIPVKGWSREQWQDEAGLPWVNTSPNMRSLAAAALYPGIGLLEHALSIGRGTDTPFEVVGAPYIDGARLAKELRNVPGALFTPIRFTPKSSVHQGESCGGIRITITDRRALRSVDLGVATAIALVRLYPSQFPLDKLQPLLRDEATLQAIREGRKPVSDVEAFYVRRKKFLLY